MFSEKMKLFFGGLLVIAGIIVAIRGPIEVKLLKARCTEETIAKVEHVFEDRSMDNVYDVTLYYYVGEKRYEAYNSINHLVNYSDKFVCYYNPKKPKENYIENFTDGPISTALYGVALIFLGGVSAGSVLKKDKNDY